MWYWRSELSYLGPVGYYDHTYNDAADTDEPDNYDKNNDHGQDDDTGMDNYDKRQDFRQE